MGARDRPSRRRGSGHGAKRDLVRKITVEVSEHDLAAAQALTGKGVTETVRAGLTTLASLRAQRELLKLRGKLDLGISVEDMKHDR